MIRTFESRVSALTQHDGRIYVGTSGNHPAPGILYIVDSAGCVEREWTLRGVVSDIALAGGRLCVYNGWGGVVTWEGDGRVDETPVFRTTGGLAARFAPGARAPLWVTDIGIDTLDGEIVSLLKRCSAIAADDARIYVGHQDGKCRVYTWAGKRIAVLNVGGPLGRAGLGRPVKVACDAGTLWVASYADRRITRHDAVTLETEHTFTYDATGALWHIQAADGRLLCQTDTEIRVFDREGNTLHAVPVPVRYAPAHLAGNRLVIGVDAQLVVETLG